jgi:hypothetical protein
MAYVSFSTRKGKVPRVLALIASSCTISEGTQ